MAYVYIIFYKCLSYRYNIKIPIYNMREAHTRAYNIHLNVFLNLIQRQRKCTFTQHNFKRHIIIYIRPLLSHYNNYTQIVRQCIFLVALLHTTLLKSYI